MSGEQPIRIVVEVISSEAVRRLEGRDEDLKAEVKRLEKRLEGVNRTLYELLETLARDKRSKG